MKKKHGAIHSESQHVIIKLYNSHVEKYNHEHEGELNHHFVSL
jgi:hypothetical protein